MRPKLLFNPGEPASLLRVVSTNSGLHESGITGAHDESPAQRPRSSACSRSPKSGTPEGTATSERFKRVMSDTLTRAKSLTFDADERLSFIAPSGNDPSLHVTRTAILRGPIEPFFQIQGIDGNAIEVAAFYGGTAQPRYLFGPCERCELVGIRAFRHLRLRGLSRRVKRTFRCSRSTRFLPTFQLSRFSRIGIFRHPSRIRSSAISRIAIEAWSLALVALALKGRDRNVCHLARPR